MAATVTTARERKNRATAVSSQPVAQLGKGVIAVWSVLVFIAFIGVWEGITRLGLVHPIVLPPPGDVAGALVDLVTSELFFTHLSTTIFETLAGFCLGGIAAFVVALLDVMFPLVRRALRPYVVTLQAMPKIALVPLIITWLGFGMASKVAQAGLLTFFPVFINTVVGLTVVAQYTEPLMRSLTASKWQTFRYLQLPSALPSMFAGLKTGLSFALIGAVVSEMIGARRGLGVILVRYQAGFDIELMYAVIVVMAIVGVALFLLIGWIDRRVVFWRRDRPFF